MLNHKQQIYCDSINFNGFLFLFYEQQQEWRDLLPHQPVCYAAFIKYCLLNINSSRLLFNYLNSQNNGKQIFQHLFIVLVLFCFCFFLNCFLTCCCLCCCSCSSEKTALNVGESSPPAGKPSLCTVAAKDIYLLLHSQIFPNLYFRIKNRK